MAEWKMLTTEEEINAALAEARTDPLELQILEAEFHWQPGLEFLRLR